MKRLKIHYSKRVDFCLALAILASAIILISGCAHIIEGAKGFAGISTKELKRGRDKAIKKVFQYDYNTCYNKTLEALAEIDAYIYAKDNNKSMIAIYVSQQDTTPVGLFFKEIDESSTQVEVSSPSSNAKEIIARRVFMRLEGVVSEGADTQG